MTVTSCAGKHMTSRSFFTLVLPSRWLIFRNCFHAVNIAIKQQQYCNTVRPQLNSDRFTQHMTSQTWWLKRLLLNYSFAIMSTLWAFLQPQMAIFWLFMWNTLISEELIFCCQCPLIWKCWCTDNKARSGFEQRPIVREKMFLSDEEPSLKMLHPRFPCNRQYTNLFIFQFL